MKAFEEKKSDEQENEAKKDSFAENLEKLMTVSEKVA